MNVADILYMAKFDTANMHTDISDNDLLRILNIKHKEIIEAIKTQVNGKYFYDEFIVDLAIGQKEYNNLPVTKIESVYIKYTTTASNYTKMTPFNVSQSTKSPDFIRDTQPASNPLVEIKDDSVFIYPVASETVTDGLLILGEKTFGDLGLASTEEDVFGGRLKEFHNILNLAIQPSIYRNEQRINEANDAENNFQLKLKEMLSDVSERYSEAIQYIEPNLNYLK